MSWISSRRMSSLRCASTVFTPSFNVLAMSFVEPPSVGNTLQHFTLSRGQVGKRVALLFSVEQIILNQVLGDTRTHVGLGIDVHEKDPGTYSFLRSTTREGRAGWVTRSDVRWLPYPIV
jgi:hypothetical protein